MHFSISHKIQLLYEFRELGVSVSFLLQTTNSNLLHIAQKLEFLMYFFGGWRCQMVFRMKIRHSGATPFPCHFYCPPLNSKYKMHFYSINRFPNDYQKAKRHFRLFSSALTIKTERHKNLIKHENRLGKKSWNEFIMINSWLFLQPKHSD